MSSLYSTKELAFQFNKLLMEEKLNESNLKSPLVEKKNYCIKQTEDLTESESFYGSYFTIYKKLIDKKPNIFNPDQKGYFGAFINEKEVERNGESLCGIPNLWNREKIEKEADNDNNLLKFYLNNYDDKDNEDVVDNKINSKKISDKKNTNNKNKSINQIPDFHQINMKKTHQLIKTIPFIILENYIINSQNENISYNSLLEETILLNPYKIINYDISLQKCFGNIIYKIGKPIDLKKLYPLLIYLIQGIPSELFKYNEAIFSFEITDLNFRFLASTNKLSKNFLNPFIEFGNMMFIIQQIIAHYLYNNDIAPYIIKKFYSQVNMITIKLNENIIEIKGKLMNNRMNLIGIYRYLEEFLETLNMIYHIFNLPEALEKYFESVKVERRGIKHFILFYEEYNYNIKSHKLINSLINCYNSFNSTKTKNYLIIKNILQTSLKSYLNFIIYLIFNNESIDQSNEYFIIKSNEYKLTNSICIDNTKVPFFLNNFKNILLNNTILLNYIKKYDNSYFSICNYKINEILNYIDRFNFSLDSVDDLESFIKFKDKIFNKKIDLMFHVNESQLAENELIKNEENIKRINHIKILKEFMSRRDEYTRKTKYREIEKKRLLYEDIQNQIILKKKKIEQEMKRMNDERLDEIIKQNEREIIKNDIIKKLREKYDLIRHQTYEIYNFSTDDKFQIWRKKRIANKKNRFELFSQMFDFDYINNFYEEVINNFGKCKNFHYEGKDFRTISNYEKEMNSNLMIPQIFNSHSGINFNSINVNINNDNYNDNSVLNFKLNTDQNESNMSNVSDFFNQSNSLNIPINKNADIIPTISSNLPNIRILSNEYPKFFIKNIIYNEIVTPIIETAIEIAVNNHKKNYISIVNSITNLQSYHKAKAKVISSNTNVNIEVNDIMNKIQVLISESVSHDSSIEIPLHIIFQEFFYDLIIKQYKIINNCFVLMMKNKFNLSFHFDIIRKIYLCNSGDMILNFMENCIDFKTLTLNSNEADYLVDLLKSELNNKNYQHSSYISPLNYFVFEKINDINIRYSIANIEMAFRLLYKPPEPLNFIFNTKLIDHYNVIFKYLFKFIIFQYVISKIYSVFKNQHKNYNKFFNKTYKIIFNSFYLLKSFQTFLFHEIIDKSYSNMLNLIENNFDIFSILELHSVFLNKILNVLNNKILLKVATIHLKFGKFYLKTIAGDSDYLDYELIKDDFKFIKLVNKIENLNDDLRNLIFEEQVIGDFNDLKYYIK